jgi:hypothetical protein
MLQILNYFQNASQKSERNIYCMPKMHFNEWMNYSRPKCQIHYGTGMPLHYCEHWNKVGGILKCKGISTPILANAPFR